MTPAPPRTTRHPSPPPRPEWGGAASPARHVTPPTAYVTASVRRVKAALAYRRSAHAPSNLPTIEFCRGYRAPRGHPEVGRALRRPGRWRKWSEWGRGVAEGSGGGAGLGRAGGSTLGRASSTLPSGSPWFCSPCRAPRWHAGSPPGVAVASIGPVACGPTTPSVVPLPLTAPVLCWQGPQRHSRGTQCHPARHAGGYHQAGGAHARQADPSRADWSRSAAGGAVQRHDYIL